MSVDTAGSECQACREEWRVWLCDLRTGRIFRQVDFINASFEPQAGRPGSGSITFHREGIPMREMYPRQTMLVFERLVSLRDPIPSTINGLVPDGVADFVAIVETLSVGLDGITTLGLKEIDQYFNYRSIRHDLVFNQTNQNAILQGLFIYGSNTPFIDPDPDSIDIATSSTPSSRLRDRTYPAANRKNLGEAIQQLTQVIDGPSYSVTGLRVGNIWIPVIIIYDDETQHIIGETSVEFDLSDMSEVTLELDGNEQALLVDAMGEDVTGDGNPAIVTVEGSLLDFPQYHAAVSWPGVSVEETLLEHGEGYLFEHKDLSPRVSFTVPDILNHPSSKSIIPGVSTSLVRIPGRYLSILGYLGDDEPFIVTRVGFSVGPEQRTSAVIEVASTFIAPKVIFPEEGEQPLADCENC